MRIANGGLPFLSWIWLYMFGLLLAGCGPARLPTIPVQGKVTWQGKPLTDGKVSFMPLKVAEGLPKRPAVGDLGPDGVYRLSSFRLGDGALPGEYRVMVHSYTSKPTLEEPKKVLVSRIPERYGDGARSGLSFTVPTDARGPLTFDVDVQSR